MSSQLFQVMLYNAPILGNLAQRMLCRSLIVVVLVALFYSVVIYRRSLRDGADSSADSMFRGGFVDAFA